MRGLPLFGIGGGGETPSLLSLLMGTIVKKIVFFFGIFVFLYFVCIYLYFEVLVGGTRYIDLMVLTNSGLS